MDQLDRQTTQYGPRHLGVRIDPTLPDIAGQLGTGLFEGVLQEIVLVGLDDPGVLRERQVQPTDGRADSRTHVICIRQQLVLHVIHGKSRRQDVGAIAVLHAQRSVV